MLLTTGIRFRLQSWRHFATGFITRMRVETRVAPVVLLVLLVSIASQTQAREPYEIVTKQTTYATKDGVAWDARPAFQLKVDTIGASKSEAVARALLSRVPLERPQENPGPAWLETQVGYQHATFRMSGVAPPPPRDDIQIPYKPAAFLGGAIIALVGIEGLPALGAAGAIAALGLVDPLNEIIESRSVGARSGQGRVYIVYRDGRTLPTWLNVVLPERAKDLATYAWSDIHAPRRRSILFAYIASFLLSQASGAMLKIADLGPLTEHVFGEFVDSAADQQMRRAKNASSSSSNPCVSIFIGQSLSTSCFEVSLKPSLSVVSPSPVVQAPLVIPSAIQGIPVPVAVAQALTQVFAAGARTVTITTPESNTIQIEQSGGGDRSDNMKGLPTGIELTGPFGEFKLERHK